MSPPGPARITDNPFYVLGLPPTASRAEVEREGQKLLGMLEIGLQRASSYDTPLGPRPRDAERVRAAMAELRDPDRRLSHELWAALRAPSGAPGLGARRGDGLRMGGEGGEGGEGDSSRQHAGRGELAPWDEALAVLGWRRP
jgi:hypothetical protein